jgi:hypothetical protein
MLHYRRGGRRKVANGRHVTGLYGASAAGEPTPPFFIFDSSAKDPARRKVNAKWLLGLPKVTVQFGLHSPQTFSSCCCVTPKGSMESDYLDQYMENCIYPLFPDMSPIWEYGPNGEVIKGPVCCKLDGGPGRLGKATHAARVKHASRGLFLFPGLQNATSANQECDQIFGPFQSACDAVADDLVSERLAALAGTSRPALAGTSRSTAAAEDEEGESDGEDGDEPASRLDALAAEATKLSLIKLDNSDLGRIVNGRPEDPIESRPFERCFTKEKIIGAWDKVGAVPLTRKGLCHPKVRRNQFTGDPIGARINALDVAHKAALLDLTNKGANSAVFAVVIL